MTKNYIVLIRVTDEDITVEWAPTGIDLKHMHVKAVSLTGKSQIRNERFEDYLGVDTSDKAREEAKNQAVGEAMTALRDHFDDEQRTRQENS